MVEAASLILLILFERGTGSQKVVVERPSVAWQLKRLGEEGLD